MLNATDIAFPVYPLKKYDKIHKGSKGALLLWDLVGTVWVLDDLSIEGSFGVRRIQLKNRLEKSEYLKLYPLQKSYSTWGSFLSNTRKVLSKTYIDSTGHVFKYKSTEFCKLVYHRILKVQVVEGQKAFLVLDGINTKIEVKAPPPDKITYAGILYSKVGYLLYEYSTAKLKDTRRRL